MLTGVIGGLLAQNVNPFSAAKLGVYPHGLSGDVAKQNRKVRMESWHLICRMV